ncbi:hypothetical protein V1477_003086, partial [Vespula maculifrons]
MSKEYERNSRRRILTLDCTPELIFLRDPSTRSRRHVIQESSESDVGLTSRIPKAYPCQPVMGERELARLRCYRVSLDRSVTRPVVVNGRRLCEILKHVDCTAGDDRDGVGAGGGAGGG